MSLHQVRHDDDEISCHICLEQVPHAGAMSVEGKEYLFFFCGQGCYVNWQIQRESARRDAAVHV